MKLKLKSKDIALVKIGLWSGVLVWMVFLVAYSIVWARHFAANGPGLFGIGLLGRILTWVMPIWAVFTSLLICVYTIRFVVKRLKKG